MSRTKEGTNDERKEAYGGWPHMTARVKLTTATHRKTNLLDKKCLLEEEDIALFLRRYFKIKGEEKKNKSISIIVLPEIFIFYYIVDSI